MTLSRSFDERLELALTCRLGRVSARGSCRRGRSSPQAVGRDLARSLAANYAACRLPARRRGPRRDCSPLCHRDESSREQHFPERLRFGAGVPHVPQHFVLFDLPCAMDEKAVSLRSPLNRAHDIRHHAAQAPTNHGKEQVLSRPRPRDQRRRLSASGDPDDRKD